MKKTKLFCSLLLCYSGLMGASENQEATLDGILRQQIIREIVLPSVHPRDIGRLSCVSRGMHKAVEPALEPANEKVAIWQSHVLNARDINLKAQRQNRDNQAFKDYVIQSIKDFVADNPGTWIKLDLRKNNLGNDLEFLQDLLHDVVTTVHTLKIDLASLMLFDNELRTLPEHLFEGLNNLQTLYLNDNKLTSLPEHIFDGLDNLQMLDLMYNELTSLPEHAFARLSDLRELNLARNQLTTLPEHVFEGLNYLQKLKLFENQLTTLPECIFEGLGNLQELDLFNDQLTSLPEHLFEGLNNLRVLELYGNKLTTLPERLFEGLKNLKRLFLYSNQLTTLPKHLFEGLNNLIELDLDFNPLNRENISLLRALSKRGIAGRPMLASLMS